MEIVVALLQTVGGVLLTTGVVSLLRMWRIQNSVIQDVENFKMTTHKDIERIEQDMTEIRSNLQAATQASLEESKIQRDSINQLASSVRELSTQMQFQSQESRRSFKYHAEHFEKIGDLQRQVDRSGRV